MRILVAAATAVALVAQPAYSQKGPGGESTKTPQQLIDAQKRKDQADIDRQYENRMKTPLPEVKDDPWSTIRANPQNPKR